MASTKSQGKTTIVVVGGGSAGVGVARPLSKSLDPAKYNLILVNPRPYTIFLPPSLRMVVTDEGQLDKQILVPYDKTFINGNGTFVQGEVTAINQKPEDKSGQLVLSNGETVSYDILVLATGSRWDGPIAFPNDPSQVDSFIQSRRQEFAKAKNILIIGGGSVGIELAGELKDLNSTKEVTIIQRDEFLLNKAYPKKMRVAAQKQMEKRGIKVVLSDSIGDVQAGLRTDPVTTQKGTTLHPDLIVRAWGTKPETEYISRSLGQDTLTSSGTVKVKPTLQLPKFPNIFAVGDILDWKEQKQAAKTGAHAGVVVKNIHSLLEDKPAAAVYKGSTEAILVTNGKNDGVMYVDTLWGVLLGGWIAATLKSKNLMVPMMRSAMGYT